MSTILHLCVAPSHGHLGGCLHPFRARAYVSDRCAGPFQLDAQGLTYPTGLIALGTHLYLAYGAADQDWLIAKIDRTALIDSLIPVRTESLDLQIPRPETLPTTMHFFSGIPAEDRARLEACAADHSRAGCKDLLGG